MALAPLDTRSHLRVSAARAPRQPLSPLFELRPEMNWIDFSGAANPLGTPQSFIDAMREAAASGELSYAPDRRSHAFRSVLAGDYGLPAGSFLVGNSVSELIHAIAQTFEPCTVGVSAPGPAEYALAASNAGHEVLRLTGPSSFVVPDREAACRGGAGVDAAILANPSYPTSRLLPKPTLLSYLDSCTWVVVDERSIELSVGGESMVPLIADHENLFVIHSLSESFALSGTPISYCIAQPAAIDEVGRYFDSSSVSMFPEVFGNVVTREKGHLERARDFLEGEIPWMQCMLNLLPGVRVFPAEANFIMCSFEATEEMDLGVESCSELVDRLQLAGFLVRKLEDMAPLDGRYFCVAVRKHEDNEALLHAMREII